MKMPKSCRQSATSSVTSKIGPNKRVGAREVCDLPCLPGRGEYASLNARWPSPLGILVLGLCSGSFTFSGRAGPDRPGARPYHSATPDCTALHSCLRHSAKLKTPNSKTQNFPRGVCFLCETD